MSLQLPKSQNTLLEPKSYNRESHDDNDHDSNSFQLKQDRAWLREQLLAGKNSPLCTGIQPIAQFHLFQERS